jgi:cytochrome b subunit of formate dehydrogenase
VSCQQCHAKHEEVPHPEGLPKPQCGSCHPAQSGQHAASVHGEEIKKGNAAAPDCATCHGSAHEIARASSDAFRKAVPQTCGMCHSEVQAEFEQSVHGTAAAKGVIGAPVCTDCHGEHSILRKADTASRVHPLHVRETCARCHGDLRLTSKFGLPSDRIASFDESFHGLASQSGSPTVANCASCHGYHNILPSTDKKSMVHPSKLAETCSACHPGAGKRFALGPVHVLPGGQQEPPPIRWARAFYLVVIPATIGFMLLHHGGDWLKKLRRLRLAAAPAVVTHLPAAAGEIRMYPWERVQHGLLAVSFIVLVWSGFALKYPSQWWALPLVSFESQWPIRGTIHRAAGAVMLGASVMHVVALITSRNLRTHWMTLFPRRRDVVEGFQGLTYNLGLRREKPHISPHSYIEKVEYWAVLWGTAVMGLTGVMLWANNLMLAYLPKVWIDLATVVHFYEAVLAALSILIWHLYSVIFDPDVYPMDLAWLTGRSPRRHAAAHAPAAQPVKKVRDPDESSIPRDSD